MRLRATLIVGAGSNHRRYEVTTIDHSEHGLRINVDSVSLTPDETVQVILMDDLGRAGRYRVVWVGPAESARAGDAGLEFLSSAIAQF